MEKDAALVSFLAKNGLGKDMIRHNDDVALRAMRLVVNESQGQKAVDEFDNQLRALRKASPQWDAGRLIDSIEKNLAPQRRPGVWFLAVTEHDIYGDNSNFLFGIAKTGTPYGLIAPIRFTAAFNEESERRERLITRLVKQALSSYGFMLGVGRCSLPACARAYPHSLAEHDAKPDQLCPECHAGFQRALRNTASSAL
jgi:predicted Zn-dependent protease